jgi:hypothetical protein
MASRQTVIFVCDLCGKDSAESPNVETHRIGLDGVEVEAEACESCWEGVVAAVAVLGRAGRQVPARTRIRNVKPWPGSTWRFTSHALIRCGERHLDPLEIVRVLDDPSITRPGKASDQEIRERNGVKAVCIPERGIVLTVARKGEEAVDSYVEGRVG